MCIRWNACHAFNPKVKRLQLEPCLFHEHYKEPTQAGIYMKGNVVLFCQLKMVLIINSETYVILNMYQINDMKQYLKIRNSFTFPTSTMGSMIPCGNWGAEHTNIAAFLEMALFMAWIEITQTWSYDYLSLKPLKSICLLYVHLKLPSHPLSWSSYPKVYESVSFQSNVLPCRMLHVRLLEQF